MEGRPWTNPEQDRVLAQGRSSGECQRLKSDIVRQEPISKSCEITQADCNNPTPEGLVVQQVTKYLTMYLELSL